MFERFDDRARRVVMLAQEEARMLNHNYIGTEHILLGIIRTGKSIATQALEAYGLPESRLDEVRNWIADHVGRGRKSPNGHIPFTPNSKQVLEFSLREALKLGHNYIGVEHQLLAIIRLGKGTACEALKYFGIDPPELRETTLSLIAQVDEVKAAARIQAAEQAAAATKERQAMRDPDELIEFRTAISRDQARQVLEWFNNGHPETETPDTAMRMFKLLERYYNYDV